MSKGLTRRDLLAAGGAALGPVTLFGAAPASSPSEPITTHGTLPTGRGIDADVVVAGGGMAGVCAALAAARNGASVVLIQDRSVLGGNASSEVRMHCVGADASGKRKGVEARESGIIEEFRLEDAVWNPQRCANVWDLMLYDAVRREANIALLLNTHCCGVQMGDGRIQAVLASRQSTQDLFTIRGKLFVDATGDGRLGAEAGAAFRMGREARDEYGEDMAPAKADDLMMGSTILFTTRQHDRPMPFKAPSWARKFPACEDLPFRSHGAWEYGYWWVEWGGELNTIKDNERIRDELLAAALGVWDHIKNSGRHPQSEKWALQWIGALPGKRESRRFIGEHVLTQQEVQRGELFQDGVAFGGWPIDLHPPAGIYSKEKPATAIDVPMYNVPLRSLYSKNIRNLLFAGRDISVSHVAFGTTRVMATCSVIGQAAGTAAALCAKGSILPFALAREGIGELQQQLLRDDAYIIGASNSDASDLARGAEIRASSETVDGPASLVINGVARGVASASNRWISDPDQPMPQWLELRFRTPQRIREIHLTFDTGFNRLLTLSHSDAYTGRMIKSAQPETVRDYEVQVIDGAGQTTVAEVTGNYQRKRIHRVEPTTVSGIRVLVKATNGDKSARLFEVRAYA